MLNSTDSGTGLVWMDNLRCDGDETDIALCKSDGFGLKTCSNNRKAAIYCGIHIVEHIWIFETYKFKVTYLQVLLRKMIWTLYINKNLFRLISRMTLYRFCFCFCFNTNCKHRFWTISWRPVFCGGNARRKPLTYDREYSFESRLK